MKDEYISISEFARRAGVSPQAIYKRLSTDLSTELKVVDNQKMLKISALSRFGLNLVDNQVDNQVVNLAQGSNEQNDTLERGILELLRAELEAKNHQLEVKEQQLREKDHRIAELTDRITEMGKAAQALHAGTMQAQLGPGPDRSQEPEQVITVEDRPAAPAEPERKRHWWPWQRKE